jgi:hypothetical protein
LNRRDLILPAVRSDHPWEFNPADDFSIRPVSTPVVMATPGGRKSLAKSLVAA